MDAVAVEIIPHLVAKGTGDLYLFGVVVVFVLTGVFPVP